MRRAADPVTQYAHAVARGRVPCGPWHRAACLRHLRDLAPAWQRAHGLRLDLRRAAQAIAVAGHMCQWQGEWAGQPLVVQPWQAFVLGSLFGWRRTDGTRRFRTAFIELPRGNGKSVLAAVIGLIGTFLDDEPGAEGFVVATKRDQARIVYDHAKHMVLCTPALREIIKPRQHALIDARSASRFVALSSDAHTLDGLRPHIVIADEVHAHPTHDVIHVMQTGMNTRRQPLLVEITTAGVSREGPWWAHREYSRVVLEDQHADETWFALIACAPDQADWMAPATWQMANPNYEITVKRDYLEAQAKRAAAMPAYQADFRRLHLGQLVESRESAIVRAHWEACAEPYTWDAVRGRVVYAGLDLGTTTDLTACVLVWADDDLVRCWPLIWIPEQTIALRSQRDRVPYDVWARTGVVRVTPGAITDYDVIRRDLVALSEQVRLVEVGYDPWNATQLATQLAHDLGASVMVHVQQGYRTLSEPTQRLLALLAAQRFRHPSHPVLTWAADKVVLARDSAGNVKPDKASATDRIDPIVALIMAVSRWMVRDVPTVDRVPLSFV